MTTGKTIVLTIRTFVGKIMSLLFNMLSRLVITFLPRSKCLLISWLQSPSAVILEPSKIKSASFKSTDLSTDAGAWKSWQRTAEPVQNHQQAPCRLVSSNKGSLFEATKSWDGYSGFWSPRWSDFRCCVFNHCNNVMSCNETRISTLGLWDFFFLYQMTYY